MPQVHRRRLWLRRGRRHRHDTYTATRPAASSSTAPASRLKACPGGQLLKSTGAEAYDCATDTDTDTLYSADRPRHRARRRLLRLKACRLGSCSSRPAPAPTTARRQRHNTTYSAGSGLQLSGTQFSIANGGVGGAQVADGSLTAADLGFVRAVSFTSSSLAAGACAGAVQSQTAQFAPGQEGDFAVFSSNPAMPLGFVLPAGSARSTADSASTTSTSATSQAARRPCPPPPCGCW